MAAFPKRVDTLSDVTLVVGLNPESDPVNGWWYQEGEPDVNINEGWIHECEVNERDNSWPEPGVTHILLAETASYQTQWIEVGMMECPCGAKLAFLWRQAEEYGSESE